MALATLLLAPVACMGKAASSGEASQQVNATPTPARTPAAEIRVQPGDEAKDVAPNDPVRITVAKGSLDKVTVVATQASFDGEEDPPDREKRTVEGRVSKGGTAWESTEPLAPGVTYKVRASAVDGQGLTTKARTSFSTLEPENVLHAAIAPLDGATVGVGMPIMLYLSHEVADKYKDDVERRLELDMSEPVEGAWHWMDDETLSFRPREYWPAGEHVTLTTNLVGVHAGEDLWGDRSRTIEFEVGDRHLTLVNAKSHTMIVKTNGERIRKFAISAGDEDHPSSSGILVAKLKQGTIVMDSASYGVPVDSPEGYRVKTYWNVRITDSGQFVHGAPWSVEAQGRRNVSHGCVNMSPKEAKWFYQFTQRGDIIKVVGTSDRVDWRNGWTHWNMSWDEWVEGSALNRSING